MAIKYSGFLDPIDGVLIKGWAVRDEPADHGALVDVLIDNRTVARVRANSYRADLETNGYQEGFAAFFVEIPVEFRDGEPHVLDVRHAGTMISLDDAPRRFTIECKSPAALREKRRWSAENLIFDAATGPGLAESLRKSRKLAIMSTYHEAPAHFAYHRTILRSLRDAGFTVLIVHAASIHRPGLVETGIPDCFTILKRNIGYDFGSYAVGVFAAYEQMHLIDEMMLINDSVVQVTDGLAPLIQRFRDVGADAVSCTDSFEHNYHLQSYAIWFGSKICRSECLPRFMANYSFTSVKENVITEGEIGLSRMLQAEGFAITALFNYQAVTSAWIGNHSLIEQQVRELPGLATDWAGTSYKKAVLERLDLLADRILFGTPLNPSHFFWDTLVEDFDCPFIKRELIITNPCNVPTYFKLGWHFPFGSEAFRALTELRHLYGGHLVPPSIPRISPQGRPKPTDHSGEDDERTSKLVPRPENGSRHLHPEPLRGIAR